MAVDNVSLAIAGAGAALVVIITIASISTAAVGLLGKQKQYGMTEVYSDEDGTSTKEATEKFSTTIPKAILGIFSVAGLGVTTALAVLATTDHDDGFLIENYVVLAALALIVSQAALTILTKAPTQVFALGVHTSLSCICVVTVLFAQLALQATQHVSIPRHLLALRIIQIVAVVIAGASGALIRRRPDIFDEKGRPIDANLTKSALSRYTFTWTGPVLDLAEKKGVLELEDLPRPDSHTRSKELAETWMASNHAGRLWLSLLRAHFWPFIFQWALTGAQSFGNVAPQFMLMHIIKILELRDKGQSVTSEAWIWVIALGLSQAIAAWVEAWLFWISFSQLAGPVRAELSTLIFRKSMRRKDVKGDSTSKQSAAAEAPEPTDTTEIAPETGPGIEAAPEPAKSDADKKDEKEAEKPDIKSTQSTVNLIGVDAKRVADFTSYNMFFPGSLFKLIVSFWFLINIIGWRALGAGLLSMLIIVPINIFFSKRYAAAQSKLMEIRDEKEAAVSEALKGVRQIKFSALEFRWQASLDVIRNRELDTLWNVFVSDTALLFCWISSPVVLSATSLAVYSISYTLTPSVAFTAIGIFNTLQVTLAVIPELTTDLIDAYVSINRIQEYLESPEIDLSPKKDSPNVSFDNATFSFPSDNTMEEGDERFVLRNVTLSFPEKELSVISGKTGSGKSLLLNAVLREVDIISGSINLPHVPTPEERHDYKANKSNWILPTAVAFVAQIPWIENATIKDNILFGLPFDEERYEKTIESCALRKDLDMLPDGERTEIGANGINLSGGQKWRLSFARALYSRAGILVLDDIFSAVDAHVGKHIFEKGLTGELGLGRTRILVTHHVALCKSKTKYLVELGEGRVLNEGLLSELEEDGTLTKIISHTEDVAQVEQDLDTTAVNSEESSQTDETADGAPLKKVDTKASVRKFVEQETKEKGGVKAKLYGDYLKSSGGWPFWMFACVIFLTQQGLSLGRSWWLKVWTERNEEKAAHLLSTHLMINNLYMSHNSSPYSHQMMGERDPDLWFYLGIYVAISFGTALIGTLTFFYIFCGSIKASRDLFTKMLYTVLRAPLRWHDTVPLGRILNRFTADFNIVDSRLANDLSFGVSTLLRLVGVIIAGVFVSPYVILLAVVLAAICILIAKKYLVAAREVKRLESIAKSPIFSQFGSTLSGIATIRAFDKTQGYVTTMSALIDDYTATFWHLWLFNRWFSWRMSMIGGLFSAIVAGVIISVPIDAALGGFALFFALEYTGAITWTIRHYTNVELDMNAAERIVEYAKLPTESQAGVSPPASWPTDGRLEVSDLSVSYAPDLPPVLKNLSFSVDRNQRVGVVGRTGAGKSSLTLALFRFLEAQTGKVLIDGLDISTIKLEDLRSRLAIIPQDPVLFSGTIRSNLDPFDERSDAELLDALKRVHLIPSTGDSTPLPEATAAAVDVDTNKNIFKSLSTPISPSGLNLSQGQRQLLCLARAIVARPKIMVLDEATSAVDMATDALIQRSIREEFTDSTLIVIAHRLSTIADFDRILVLDAGEVKEFGSPADLMRNEDGIFRAMVGDSGESEKLKSLILG